MDSYDETWFAYPLYIAAAVEIDLAVITACAPALRPFLIIYLRPLFTSVTGSRSRSTGASSKKRGYTSAPSEQTSKNGSVMNSNVDKKNGVIVSQQLKMPKRSKGRTEYDEPERFSIVRRRSFEVFHENRNARMAPLHESEIGLALMKPDERDVEKGFSNTNFHGASQSRDGFSDPSKLLHLSPQSSFTWTESGHNSPSAKNAQSRRPTHEEAFESTNHTWKGDNDGISSTPKPRHGIEQSFQRYEPHKGERRWDIQRNPFREAEQYEDVERSGGGGGGKRTNESYKGIELRGIARSQSLNQSLNRGKATES
jgi:hypothetical protein